MPHRSSTRARAVRPSLLLWRWRHLVIAVCVAGASLLVLSLFRPAEPKGTEVLVVVHGVEAGEVIESEDVTLRTLPDKVLPRTELPTKGVVGTRAAVALAAGTILTMALTSASDAVGLADDEQLIQVPVDIGAGLAAPGARVDVVGESTEGAWYASSQPDLGETAPPAMTSQEPTQDGAESTAAATDTGAASRADNVLTTGARVVRVEPLAETSQFGAGSKVTIVTLAVRRDDASLVVGAATHESLGLIMSPS